MDRVGGRWRKHDVALVENREHHVPDSLLRSNRDDRLRVGVELGAVAPLVPVADRATQFVDAARDRVAMVGGFAGGLDQLADDMRRRRLVGISHAEVDDILAGPARISSTSAWE